MVEVPSVCLASKQNVELEKQLTKKPEKGVQTNQ